MKEILHNLALMGLVTFCKNNNIPPNGYKGEGTKVIKRRRVFIYDLVSATTGTVLASVQFHKNAIPSMHAYAQTTKPTLAE
jgi:hypothetical protein